MAARNKHLTFNVSRAPDGTIRGHGTGCVMHEDGKQVTWLSTPFEMPPAEAFPLVLDMARQHGIAQLGIEESEPGLFASLGFGEAQRPA